MAAGEDDDLADPRSALAGVGAKAETQEHRGQCQFDIGVGPTSKPQQRLGDFMRARHYHLANISIGFRQYDHQDL